MKSLMFVLVFAMAALTGCAGLRTTPDGTYVETSWATQEDTRKMVAVNGAAAAARQLGQNGTAGFSATTIGADGSVTTQTSSSPVWGGGFGNGAVASNPWAAQYVALTSPPPVSVGPTGPVVATGTTDPTVTGRLDKLEQGQVVLGRRQDAIFAGIGEGVATEESPKKK